MSANGTQVVAQSVTSVAAANAFFTDHSLDLGQLSGTALSVDIELSEVFDTPGTGYAFNLPVGDPPLRAVDQPTHAAMQQFTQAMAAFGDAGPGALTTGPDHFQGSGTNDLHLSLPGHA